MEMISLFEWSKRTGIAYSVVTKWFERGELTGAIREGRYIRVPVNTLPLKRGTIACVMCRKPLSQITNTHLSKAHGIGLAEYRRAYPAAPLVAEDVGERIAAKLMGITRSEETRAKVSKGRKGIIPKDHPRHTKGTYRISEETRRKMSAAKAGKPLSKEHRDAIRDGRKLVAPPIHLIAYSRNRKGQPSPLKGRKFVTHPRASIAVWVEAELRDLAKQAAFLRGQTLSTYVANLIRKDFKR